MKAKLDMVDKLKQRIAEQRELVAQFMIRLGLATGHGESIEDLLSEAEAQIREERERIAELEAQWISVEDRLPELGVQVILMTTERYWNTPDGVHEAHVTATGYLAEFGHKYWAIFGERAMELNSFTHWMPLPAPPKSKDHYYTKDWKDQMIQDQGLPEGE